MAALRPVSVGSGRGGSAIGMDWWIAIADRASGTFACPFRDWSLRRTRSGGSSSAAAGSGAPPLAGLRELGVGRFISSEASGLKVSAWRGFGMGCVWRRWPPWVVGPAGSCVDRPDFQDSRQWGYYLIIVISCSKLDDLGSGAVKTATGGTRIRKGPNKDLMTTGETPGSWGT